MNKEQIGQLEHCLCALKHDFYWPLGSISFQGFKADRDYCLCEAARHDRQDFPAGSRWGGALEYCWLFSSIVLPPEAEGERIVLSLNPGGEATVFVNGESFGTRRAEWVQEKHHYIVDSAITGSAVPGTRFDIALEVFGGTPLPYAPTRCSATGPVFPEEGVVMAELPECRIGENTYGIWNEQAYQLYLDLEVLYEIWQTQPQYSYLREKVGVELGRVLDFLDMEQMRAMRRSAYGQARRMLESVMKMQNGTYAPSMSVIANSHIDVAWLWSMDETRRKTVRTFSQQIRHLEEYPEAMFIQSQSVLYEMCRKEDPKLFERIRASIEEGRWIADGGMWVEPDTNIPSGESLIRQFLYGTSYFEKEFGVKCHIAWLPDTFGYSAVLPQIVAGFGLEGMTTQKIFWTYNDAEKFPYHNFLWRGMDGTSIRAFLHMQYESFVNPKALVEKWNSRVDQDGSGQFLLPFGYGDGGGGPTRDDFEYIRRERDIQGVPRLRYENPASFLERTAKDLPTYCGELYFPCHRGTYTVQALVKKRNREAEEKIRGLETVNAIKAYEGKAVYHGPEIEKLWKDILLNQFHDIVPGSAIAEVNESAVRRYEDVIGKADAMVHALLDKEEDKAVTLFNLTGTARDQVVELDRSFESGVSSCEGKAVPYCRTEDGVLARVEVPSYGQVSLVPSSGRESEALVKVFCTDGLYWLENSMIKAGFDASGHIVELQDQSGRSLVGGPSNVLHLYRDVPRKYDAWDIDSQTEGREVDLEEQCSVSIGLSSALRCTLVFEHRFLSSVLRQAVVLDAATSVLRFETEVDWHERHKLLKVAFNTGIMADECANQIQFGHIMRPAHRSRQYDRDRFEVCNHGFTALYDSTHGAAVLNDCKYGVSVNDGVIALSLLRGATDPDPAADQGRHSFCYAYYPYEGRFEDSEVVCRTAFLNSPLLVCSGASAMKSSFSVEDEAVVISSAKMAEDGSGDLVLRLYESMNGRRKTILHTALEHSEAFKCDMKENILEKLDIRPDGGIVLSLRGFEIVTLRIRK